MSKRQQTERELRAQTQVNEIIEKVGPREGTEVALVLNQLTRAENAVADCRQAAEAGVETGTMRFTADVEDEKAEQFAAFIAKEWQRICGEDNDQGSEQSSDQLEIPVRFYVGAGDEASAERAVMEAIEQAKDLVVTFTGVTAEIEEGSMSGEEMFNVYAAALIDAPEESSARGMVLTAGETVVSCSALIEEFSICA